MRKRIWPSLFLALLFLQSAAGAFPNEPQGFRGMKWGQSVEAVRESKGKYNVQYMRKEKRADVYYIVLEDGDRYLGRRYIDDLYAVFWNDRLYRSVAYFYGIGTRENAAKCYAELRALAVEAFGPPSEEVTLSPTTVETRWLGEEAQIFLWHQDNDQNLKVPCVRLVFQNSALFAQMCDAPKTVW